MRNLSLSMVKNYLCFETGFSSIQLDLSASANLTLSDWGNRKRKHLNRAKISLRIFWNNHRKNA